MKSIPLIHACSFRHAASIGGVSEGAIRLAVKRGELRVYHTADAKPMLDIRQVRKLYAG